MLRGGHPLSICWGNEWVCVLPATVSGAILGGTSKNAWKFSSASSIEGSGLCPLLGECWDFPTNQQWRTWHCVASRDCELPLSVFQSTCLVEAFPTRSSVFLGAAILENQVEGLPLVVPAECSFPGIFARVPDMWVKLPLTPQTSPSANVLALCHKEHRNYAAEPCVSSWPTKSRDIIK